MLGGAFILKKYAGFVSKVAKFGFYIILFLCISAIGISGYVMYLARNTLWKLGLCQIMSGSCKPWISRSMIVGCEWISSL